MRSVRRERVSEEREREVREIPSTFHRTFMLVLLGEVTCSFQRIHRLWPVPGRNQSLAACASQGSCLSSSPLSELKVKRKADSSSWLPASPAHPGGNRLPSCSCHSWE